MGGEGGVVAAAVLRVQHQAQVQNVGLQRGVLAVRSQQGQNVLRGGQVRPGGVDVKAVAVLVVVVGLVGVHRDEREDGNEVDALTHHVGQGDVVRLVVVAGHGQNAAGQGVHHVAAGCLEDDVPHEIGGQAAVEGQLFVEGLQLLCGGQLAEHQKIGRLLKAEALVMDEAAGELFHRIAAIVQLALAGHLFAVRYLAADDLADLRQTRQHAGAVQIAQAALDVVAHIVLFVDLVVGKTHRRQRLQLGGDAGVIRKFRHDKRLLFPRGVRRVCLSKNFSIL